MNGLGLQESSNGALEALNTEHNIVSEQLVGLLGFNVHRMQETLKKEYEAIPEHDRILLRNDEIERIEEFCSRDMSGEKMTEEIFIQIEKEREIIRKSLINIDFPYKTLEFKSVDDFMFKMNMGEPSQALDFGNVSLGSDYDVEEVKLIFKALPMDLKKIKFPLSSFYKFSLEENISIFKELPSGVREIDFVGNLFHRYSLEDLKFFIGNLPSGLSSLGLNMNNLGQWSTEDLVDLFSSLPKSIKILDIGGNNFTYRNAEEFKEIVDSLPDSLLSLSFYNDDLSLYAKNTMKNMVNIATGKGNFKEFKNSISALPSGLLELDLGKCSLSDFSYKQLKEIFQSLPDGLKILDLKDNKLDKFFVEELSVLLGFLPKGLKVLKMEGNSFENYESHEMVVIIESIPREVEELDLTFTRIGKHVDHLKEIFAGLPKGIKTLRINTDSMAPAESYKWGLPKGTVVEMGNVVFVI